MKWFRKQLKHGSRLALFALAIQFALSFGHFHSFAAQAAPAIATGLTLADLDYARSLATQDTASKVEHKQRPATPDTDHSADACAICAVISLAGNVLFATPPLLQLPQAVQLLYLTTHAEFVHLNPVHPAFQPRAPPAS
jgi:hypothetical protein